MRDKITVVGSLNYDIILKISRLPEKGETFPANDIAFSSGGKGANQAVQAAKLGVDTYLIGCVGNDPNGQFLLDTVSSYGVNTDFVNKIEGSSGLGVVNAMDDGSVFAVIARGANFQMTKKQIDDAVHLFKESKIVILQMEIDPKINEYVIDKAKEAGCIVLMNAAPAAPIDEEYMKKIDILVVNEVEAAYYLGGEIDSRDKAEKGAKEFFDRYGNSCVITLGSEGAVAGDKGNVAFIPAMKVPAVESTGAGDSFIGGMSYALVQGMNLADACRFATKCSAVTVCRCGAQPSMPTFNEINQGI